MSKHEVPSPIYPPIEKTLPDLELGKAAEHLVVADLILQGYRAYLTGQGLPYDVVVDIRGRLIRIQVKATREQRSVPQRANPSTGYLFHVRRAGKGGRRKYLGTEFDILAFVGLDTRSIAYMPFVDGLRQTIILRPIGHIAAGNATRVQNIDQFPFADAVTRWLDQESEDRIDAKIARQRLSELPPIVGFATSATKTAPKPNPKAGNSPPI